ncbi:MAG TPA: hypothetical protein VHD83_25400, partial [Puia sp.]|nr:hypothetical protein [Puia sp.]
DPVTDYALLALPVHLRNDATVYLLDPQKGYYVGHQGSNGYICFIARTEWEWSEFRNDLCTPISYDAEGARSIFPVYMDVAAMRASGKYQATQIRDSIIHRERPPRNSWFKTDSDCIVTGQVGCSFRFIWLIATI